jgi:hypothetical protein
MENPALKILLVTDSVDPKKALNRYLKPLLRGVFAHRRAKNIAHRSQNELLFNSSAPISTESVTTRKSSLKSHLENARLIDI